MEPAVKPPNEYAATLRHLLNSIGAILATKGWVSSEDWLMYSGLIIAVFPYVWTFVKARASRYLVESLTTEKNAAVKVAIEAAQSEMAITPTAAPIEIKRRIAEAVRNGKH